MMRVLISGAGVAGPSLAWFLAKTGAKITIVDRSTSLLAQGQNIDVNGSALKLVKMMGLMDQLRKYNTTEKGTQFVDSRGRTFAPFPVSKTSTASLTCEFEILRGDLALILYEATKDLPNVEYRFNTTVKNVIDNGEDKVKVELSDGKQEEYDLLVAADGQWSRIRKHGFPSESVRPVDMNMYAAYWTIPRLPTDNDWWNIFLALRSRIITLRPDPHGTMRAMFTLMPCDEPQKKEWEQASRSGDRETQRNLLWKEFSGAGWQVSRFLEAMETAPDFYFQSIQQIKMSEWSVGRVVCLGDAAFCPTPLTGMGASLAILGGYVLSGELSKLKDDEHPVKALQAYDTVFRPFVEKIQEVPSIFPGIVHPKPAWKRSLFHLLISIISRIAAIITAFPALLNRKVDDEDYKLPHYPVFEERISKPSASQKSNGSS